MGLEKEAVKPKSLAFRVTEEYHAEVNKFCDDRMWSLSKFLQKAIDESMAKVIRAETKSK